MQIGKTRENTGKMLFAQLFSVGKIADGWRETPRQKPGFGLRERYQASDQLVAPLTAQSFWSRVTIPYFDGLLVLQVPFMFGD